MPKLLHARPPQDGAEERQGAELCDDIVGQPHVQVSLSMQDDAVADDVVDRVHQREEERNQQRDEGVSRDMKGAGEIVFAAGIVREIESPANDKGEEGRNRESQDEIAAISQLRNERAPPEGAKLRPFITPADRLTDFGDTTALSSRR